LDLQSPIFIFLSDSDFGTVFAAPAFIYYSPHPAPGQVETPAKMTNLQNAGENGKPCIAKLTKKCGFQGF
jgi:hypothetical protein